MGDLEEFTGTSGYVPFVRFLVDHEKDSRLAGWSDDRAVENKLVFADELKLTKLTKA